MALYLFDVPIKSVKFEWAFSDVHARFNTRTGKGVRWAKTSWRHTSYCAGDSAVEDKSWKSRRGKEQKQSWLIIINIWCFY